jgi:hypothetical protein
VNGAPWPGSRKEQKTNETFVLKEASLEVCTPLGEGNRAQAYEGIGVAGGLMCTVVFDSAAWRGQPREERDPWLQRVHTPGVFL